MSFSTSSTSSRAFPSSHLSSSPLEFDSIDPILHFLRFLPYGFLHPLCLCLKLPSSLVLPSPMTIFFLFLLTYFAIVSRLVYDIIVEPPGIGSTQDHSIGVICPIVFLPGCINGQYIIEGLSSDFMFMLGAVSLILMDLALDCNWARSVRTSFAVVGTSAMFIAYAMNPHQDPQLPLVIPLSFLFTVANLPPIQDPLFRRFIS